jgi:hypothetical protein
MSIRACCRTRLKRTGRCALVLAVFSTGCLTPSVRYTRTGSGGTVTSSTGTPRRVSAGWDYRKTYSVPRGRLEHIARGYLGIPYRFGGMSRRSTDCSGLVCMVYRDVAHVKLPHSTRKLRVMGRKVSAGEARSGDLVFFRRGAFGRVGHVGIYLHDAVFIHASTKKGVMYSSLHDGYYKKNFVEMRRLFK